MIQIELFGTPIPWTAPRIGATRAYSPKAKEKEHAIWQIKSQHRDGPIDGALMLDFTFYIPIPLRTSGVRRRQMLAGLILPTVRPDLTNYQKFYEDCLMGTVIHDDNAVTDCNSRKRYSEKPGVLIRIFNLNHEKPACLP